MEPFTRRLPSEIPSMSSEPPLARIVSLPLASQANFSSTWDSGLIITSVVRQMNRGHPAPSSIITKSPGFGIGSRPAP